MGGGGGMGGMQGMSMSDEDSKKRIAELEGMNRNLLSSLEGRESYPEPAQPDYDALEAARKAPAYSYEYKDPDKFGAAPGRQVGVMAQDLEKTPRGAETVFEGPNGKMVDTGRLELMNTGAIQAQQEELDELARRVAVLQDSRGSGDDWRQFNYGR
jgi:hypothetical protein